MMNAESDGEAVLDMDPSVARKIPYQFARKNGIVALNANGGRIAVGLREGFSLFAISELRRVFGVPVIARLMENTAFHTTLENAYASDPDGASVLINDIERAGSLQDIVDDIPRAADLLDGVDTAPVIKLINTLLSQAARERASDIHFDVFEERCVIKMRVDGVLRDILFPPKPFYPLAISRLKVMAGLDIAEKRLPQDGRFSLKLGGRNIDARLATIPCAHGERASLRLLDKSSGVIDLARIGMSYDTRALFENMIMKPHGVILVTGPTGSGKSTTLYAAIDKIRGRRLNIMTVEDPVEYEFDGVSQTQVNPRIGLTFAASLRSILRHDPDVIMIGEIRDPETAKIAVQASLTGHLVLATLHTNDSVSAVTRLANMGVEPYLLASSLLGVVAQRLVRVLCPHCREPYDWPGAGESVEKKPTGSFFKPKGCPECQKSGYSGRTGVFEMFTVNDDVARFIHGMAPERDIRSWLVERARFVSLNDVAISLAARGITSVDEALGVADS